MYVDSQRVVSLSECQYRSGGNDYVIDPMTTVNPRRQLSTVLNGPKTQYLISIKEFYKHVLSCTHTDTHTDSTRPALWWPLSSVLQHELHHIRPLLTSRQRDQSFSTRAVATADSLPSHSPLSLFYPCSQLGGKSACDPFHNQHSLNMSRHRNRLTQVNNQSVSSYVRRVQCPVTFEPRFNNTVNADSNIQVNVFTCVVNLEYFPSFVDCGLNFSVLCDTANLLASLLALVLFDFHCLSAVLPCSKLFLVSLQLFFDNMLLFFCTEAHLQSDIFKYYGNTIDQEQ